jgi:hypothetical protein
MPETKPIPILLEMMFGESARVSVKTASERLLVWAQAFDEWLESRKGGRTRMYNSSFRAWKQLLSWRISRPGT